MSLQYCKLIEELKGNTKEWMENLGTKNECDYKEKDRRLKDKFINDINDDDTMTKIIMELTTFKKTNEIPSEQVLYWARRMEVQIAQKVILDEKKESKEYDAIRCMSNRTMPQTAQKETEMTQSKC